MILEIMKKIITIVLKYLALLMLKKHKPEIIAITGNVGKTTTTQAIGFILAKKFSVIVPEKSYNTEIGVPLAIFQEKVPFPFTSASGWIKVFFSIFKKLIFQKDYSQILILEFGAGKPGDIQYLCGFIKPKIGIVTAVGQKESLPTHLLQFKSIENIFKEKSYLPKSIEEKGFALLNYDDRYVRKMADFTKAKTIFYGFSENADFFIQDIKWEEKGISFALKYKNKIIKFQKIPIIAPHLLYSLLPAIICAHLYGFSFEEIKKILKNFSGIKGRMQLLEGRNQSLILDDSYNASPLSMKAALDVLSRFSDRRKVCCLGTMNELGDFEEEGHRMVGRKASKICDLLITVGKPAKKYLADEAIKQGFLKNNIFNFDNSFSAGIFLKNKIKENDVILVKGSQNNVRMEWLVEKIMAHPEKSKELLVRQGSEWEKPKKLKD